MPSLLLRVSFSLSVLVCGRFLVVGQFGVSEIDCLQNRASLNQTDHYPFSRRFASARNRGII